MSARRFLQNVEQTGLVSAPLLDELRKRIAESNREIRPEMLAKLLVDRGELTPAQARKLVAASLEGPPATPSVPPPSPRIPSAPESELTIADDESLELVDDEDELENDIELIPETELGLAIESEAPEAILLDDDDLVAESLPTPPSGKRSPASTRQGGRTTPPPFPTPPVDSHDLLDEVTSIPDAPAARRLVRQKGFRGLWQQLFGRRRPQKSRWDSPLILYGGGALILLLAAAFGFIMVFRGESADEMLKTAEESYKSRSYPMAAEAYEKFRDAFPQHEKTSHALVRIELAKIRESIEGAKNWEDGLTKAESSLPKISGEKAFADARAELVAILPDISNGLVEAAQKTSSTSEKERLVALAKRSFELVNNSVYLPTSVRQSQTSRIEDIETNLQFVLGEIERSKDLDAALQELKGALASTQIANAYRIRDGLLRKHPQLDESRELADVLREVAKQEVKAVRIEEVRREPQTADRPAVTRGAVFLSDQRGGQVAELKNQVASFLCRGAVYGLDAESGRVLWRRYVGYETDVHPQPIDASIASDFILVDALHAEVVRVKSTTGELVWRQSCPTPIRTPRLVGPNLMVTCGSGDEAVLLRIDASSGIVDRQVHFPVGCDLPPTFAEDRQELFQLGNHSSVYVLDASSLNCKDVLSVGHVREGIQVGPSYSSGLLLICENAGADSTQLHTWMAPAPDSAWTRRGNLPRQRGHVVVPPTVDGRRLVVVTEVGEMQILEVPSDGGDLREVAHRPPASELIGPTYVHLSGTRLFLASDALSAFELQSTRGQVVPQWTRHAKDRFWVPLQVRNNMLFHVRRRAGMFGMTIGVTRIDASGGDPIWETDVAVPSHIVVDSKGGVIVATSNGAVFPIDGQSVREGNTSRKADRLDPRLLPRALTQHMIIGPQSVLASDPPIDQIAILDHTTRKLKLVPLKLEGDRADTELVTFGSGMLAPSRQGPVHFVNGRGESQGSPFLPRVEAGSAMEWRRPTVLDGPQFVIAGQQGRLYRVMQKSEPASLIPIKENQVAGEWRSHLAFLDGALWGVLRGESGTDALARVNPEDLTVIASDTLMHTVNWGPETVGDAVLVVDGEILQAYGPQGKRWEVALSSGQLAGTPLALGDDRYAISTAHGMIMVIEKGTVTATVEVGEPLGGGPVLFQGRILVSGWDGTLYLVELPK